MSKKDRTLNEKMQEFDKMVEWFSSDEFELSKALEKYKVALAEAEEIGKDLDELKNEIVQIEEEFNR